MLIVITPILGWSLPALAPFATAVAGYLGFSKLTQRGDGAWAEGPLTDQLRNLRIVRIPFQTETVEPVAEEMGYDEFLTFKKEEVTLIFRKDERGRFFVEVMGPSNRTAQDLQRIGEEFAINLIQEFAHSRLVRELDRRGITVVAEERAENGDLVLRTRKWG